VNDFLSVPEHVARCPYCGLATLVVEFDEWDAETRHPTESGTHVSCTQENYDEEQEQGDHDYMPYVYWLPVQQRVYHWLKATGYVVPENPAVIAEKLRRWNVGEPIRGGV
jgi:hypothetical protein